MFSYPLPHDMFVEQVNGWFAACKPRIHPEGKNYFISLHATYKEAYGIAMDWYFDFRERAE